MKAFITGGTGFVGTTLVSELVKQGHEASVLTRSARPKRPFPGNVTLVEGDPTKPGQWQEKAAEHDVIINLAGASIFSLWTQHRKNLIRESRILTTRHLVDALPARKGRETLLLSTSAVGYYGFHEEEALKEDSPPGDGFLSNLGQEWEAEALRAEEFGARVVICRFGIVLGSKGGALQKMIPSIKWYVGSYLANGRQWFSWIHEQDLVNIFLFLIQQKDLYGPVNCTAPNPVTNREFTKALARALKRPILLPPVPAFVLNLILGEFATTLVKGQKVVPAKLLENGFQFSFPNVDEALDDLIVKSNQD